ncbi:hypothetical protein RCCS2_14909 [Roseobacter sp. CCS2]|nr:AraC family transcriptional regulator [Roseobacter sp. CCS2]EBA12597.1 hypothetical protein RCCS2_14909 [Roseobacter sp. CCS2]
MADAPGQSIVLPDGRCDIIIRRNRNAPDVLMPVITGPATRAYTVTYDVGDTWFGLRLRPESAVALWRGDLEHAVDTVLRGQDAIDLVPALATHQYCDLMLDRLAGLALAAPFIDTRLTHALDILHASGGRIRVAQLARFAACSPRHLNRLFRGHTGLGTKTYAQLVQFHRTLNLITRGRVPITDAALEGGYADHAHMTRAFRRFGGFVPSKLPPRLTLPQLFAQ